MGNNQMQILSAAGEQHFGQRVAELRKAAGLNQEDVAKRLSMSGRSYVQSTVAKIEKAMRPTRVGELYLLASIFNVEVTDLFTPAEGHGLVAELRALENTITHLQSEIAVTEARTHERHRELAVARTEHRRLLERIEALDRRGEDEDDGVDPEA